MAQPLDEHEHRAAGSVLGDERGASGEVADDASGGKLFKFAGVERREESDLL